ncbi:hypothetical protein [Microbacterium sp. SSM24]|uniref:hypothetical protein n=1 Tax=Microbacterium sp. SSM24 TaxID=2991714 RepID=UPI002225F5E3|nr:hypothetical protein [Microbacterium sp. SSM24]MCW3492532.1 hypothetical protein [Microbacterium sp. SSM24]
MNLLSAVMPGIREARTPLSIGAMWMTCVFLVAVPNWSDLAGLFPGLKWVAEALRAVPVVYVFGGLAFAAYLVGLATQPLSTYFGKLLLRPLVRAETRADVPDGRAARALFMWVRKRVDVSRYLAPISDAVTSAYVKAGLPATMSLHYESAKILGRLDATALQLWKSNPDQYQEYDRLRAERNFRRGVWLPLLGIGLAIALQLTFWVGLLEFGLVLAGCIVLLYQSWALDQRRTVLIANALFQGLVEDSELKTLVQTLATLTLPPNWREQESVRCAVTAVAFAKMGDFEESDNLTWEAADAVVGDAVPDLHFSDRTVDLNSKKSRRAIAEVADTVRDVYISNQEADEIPVFDARLKKALDRISTAGREAPA